MRSSLKRPSRRANKTSGALSTESRLTAETAGTGSSPGSSTTSVGSPRIVVVHGATIAVFSLFRAASRERTTTGRCPAWGDSHHHTSPHRTGAAITIQYSDLAVLHLPSATPGDEGDSLRGKMPNPPTRPAHQGGNGHMPRTQHQSRLPGNGQLEHQARHPSSPRHWATPPDCGTNPTIRRLPSCSPAACSCHNCSINVA